MKKYFYIFAAAATCMLAACAKQVENAAEEAAPVKASGNMVFIQAKAGSDATKAEIDNSTAKFTWSAGDQIAVYANGYKLSDALAEGGTNSATFAFSGDFDEATRANFAVFPASLVVDEDENPLYSDADDVNASLKINLPSSYTLAQVQDNVSPTPMIATNVAGEGLSFKHVAALIRITVKSIPKDANTIKVTFPGMKVQGEFTVTGVTSDNPVIVTEEAQIDGDDTITITDLNLSGFAEELVINIPVPTGAGYLNVRVGSFDTDDYKINSILTPIKVVDSVPTAWDPTRKATRKVTAYLPVFTVSGSNIQHANRKLVVFAPGNLQAKLDVLPAYKSDDPKTAIIDNFGTASEWRFADEQYIALGNSALPGRSYSTNSLQAPEEGDYIDLFSWIGNDYTNNELKKKPEEYKYGISYCTTNGTSVFYGNSTKEGADTVHLACDWGKNVIKYKGLIYDSNTWRTPTGNDWYFVLTERMIAQGSGTSRIQQGAKATLKDGDNTVACGLIIFPDQYSHPYGVAPVVKAYSQSNKTYDSSKGGAKCSDNIYTLEDWAKMEEAGCVFLPLTNTRDFGGGVNRTNYPGDAWYFSNSLNNTSSIFALAFNDLDSGASAFSPSTNNLQQKKSKARTQGCGVRLVRDVN